MLPVITTTHAIPQNLPATHLISLNKVKFCSRCLKVLDVQEDLTGKGKKRSSHHCKDLRAAHRPSISVPFS
jgi:hypothetical protein